MDGTKGPPSNLLFDDILIDSMLCCAVVLARSILGAGVQRFLCTHETRISLWLESCSRARYKSSTHLHRTPSSGVSLAVSLETIKGSR
jgi:hypothetical protein